MQILETLKQIRNVIPIPQRWTKGVSAVTNKGMQCEPNDIYACRFCLEGAINRVTGKTFTTPEFKEIEKAILYQVNVNYDRSWQAISEFNDADTTTHKDILEAIDDAILTEELKNE